MRHRREFFIRMVGVASLLLFLGGCGSSEPGTTPSAESLSGSELSDLSDATESTDHSPGVRTSDLSTDETASTAMPTSSADTDSSTPADSTQPSDSDSTQPSDSDASSDSTEPPSTPPTSSCSADAACDDGYYCEFMGEDPCGRDGSEGECREQPVGCDDEYRPVCGCDGQTYSNRCEAFSAGTDYLREGFCPGDGEECTSNNECQEEDYCVFPESDPCGLSEAGECLARPLACIPTSEPVCGCDGSTYHNECVANAAGVNVVAHGACERPCDNNEECNRSEFCYFDMDDNLCGRQGPGVCELLPGPCPEIYDPVCGCDGRTYDNECFAHQARVNIQHEGTCEPSSEPACESNADCELDEYCYFDPQSNTCGERHPEGECRLRTECEPSMIVVCGCDGESYGSPCAAASEGMNIRSYQPCPDEPSGCHSSSECERDEFCSWTEDDRCGEEGTLGTCEAQPTYCLPVIAPVCGCDGRSYDNACAAYSVGVDVASEGPCTGPEPERPCSSNSDCPALRDFCHFELEDQCGVFGQGECRGRPESCNTDDSEIGRVCGCDGRTYSSECLAWRSGVSISSEGPCPGIDPPVEPPFE